MSLVQSQKQERINDFFRSIIDRLIGLSAIFFKFIVFFQIKTYRVQQAWLKRKYRITEDTPIHGYDQDTIVSIESRFHKLKSDAVYAYTSGSTDRPKKIAYDRKRLRKATFVFINAFFRYLAILPQNRSLFIFSSLCADRSLTSLLLTERGTPLYLCSLQAPHRVQNHPIIQALAKSYGDTAVRFWILAVSNPGMIYATNPSTIAIFFNDLYADWARSSALIKDYINQPQKFSLELEHIYNRIASGKSNERLKQISSCSQPLAIKELFPGLQAFACWNGGYVNNFIDQIRRYLPADQYQHFPMYSMSTETIETIPGLNGFLPMAPGAFYEFIEEGKEDISANIISANSLIPGKIYSMLVSDDYGLKRYQTEDLFKCVALVRSVPDLRFVRRRNLSYSFTGEKLTAEQLCLAFEDAESNFPEIQNGFLTCFPSESSQETAPSYCIVYVFNEKPRCNIFAVTSHIQERLKSYNHEFKSKIESRRLGKLNSEMMPTKDFLRHLTGTSKNINSISQIKILPMYTKLWEHFITQ
jgi:GH3 auxin-responsive promoter